MTGTTIVACLFLFFCAAWTVVAIVSQAASRSEAALGCAAALGFAILVLGAAAGYLILAIGIVLAPATIAWIVFACDKRSVVNWRGAVAGFGIVASAGLIGAGVWRFLP